MYDKIKNKIYKAFQKYGTDCLIGIIRDISDVERKVVIVRTRDIYGRINNIYFIGKTGFIQYFYKNILYVRDLEDIAYNAIFNK